MYKLRSLPYAVLAVSLFAAGGASAQSMWSIDQREAQQQQRINEGRRDGSLTRSEAYRLQQGENRIERYEARAKADGVVTQAERQRLDGMLDREGRAIHRERTDGQRADGHGGWDRDRGNFHGGDNNRGNHYGWENNRGNHNGWDQASANRNNWGDNDRHQQGGVNRPEHGAFNGHPQPTGGTNNPHGGFNGYTPGTGQPPATTPSTGHTGWTHNQPPATTPAATPTQRPTTRPTTTASNQPRMIQASAPAPRQVAPTTTTGGRSNRR